VDWARRFFDYLVDQQGGPQPQVHAEAVRDYLTHLAVHKRVSASTQNQAMCAILFLCREVLALNPEALSLTPRPKPGQHLPVVLSIPETAALLAAMRGLPQIMAGVIYGGGLRVSECCELRVKDIDFDQSLVFVRSGKGNKDRSTLLAEIGRDQLRAQLRKAEALHQAGRCRRARRAPRDGRDAQRCAAAADRARQRRRTRRRDRGHLRAGDGGCLRVGRRAGDAGEGTPQGLLRPGLLPLA
jgi:site-specific recombinase XerD